MSEKKELKISSILEDLENGLSRGEIAKKYEISPAELKLHFEHPKLKGKKPKKKLVAVYALVDDTEETPMKKLEEKAEETADVVTDTTSSPEIQEEKPLSEEAPFPPKLEFE